MNEKVTVAGHYCGQTQPHAAHVWETPRVYGAATLISTYQCAGLLFPPDPTDPADLREADQ